MKIQLPFYVRLTCALISVTLIIFLMHVGRTIFIPLFFSVLLSFMLLPIVQWLEQKKLSRFFASLISILLFLGLLALLIIFLVTQIGDFSRELPQLSHRIQTGVQELQQWIDHRYHVNYNTQLSYLSKMGAGIAGFAGTLVQSFFISIGGFVIWTIFVFIFTFFILIYRALISKFLVELFQEKHHASVNDVMFQIKSLSKNYVLGLLLEMIIIAVINCSALLILGVKYALLLGMLAAVLNIIPYIGIYTAAALAAIITLGNSTPLHALQVVILLFIVHFVDANILMPRIVGRRVKMNPLITIIAVLTGTMLWGLSGTFLFIPMVAMLKIIFERVEGLKPWAILMGTIEKEKRVKK